MINIFLGLVAMLGLILSGWYFAHPDHSQWTKQHPVEEPDMFIEQVHTIKFNAEGQPIHYLITPKLTHYPHNNKNVLLQPRLQLTYKDHAPWQIQAAQGVSLHGTDELTLSGNVKLQQPAGPQNPARTVFADEIIYYPDEQFATTTTAITMTEPGLQISSIGMNADIKQESVELLAKVRIRYDNKAKA